MYEIFLKSKIAKSEESLRRGNEKDIICSNILPGVVNKHLQLGGLSGTILDIGAGDGFITERLKNLLTQLNGVVPQSHAIEPNPLYTRQLQRSSEAVFVGDWESWHASNPEQKIDFVLSSHSLYFQQNPLDAIEEMSSHLNSNGSLCVIVEDWKLEDINF